MEKQELRKAAIVLASLDRETAAAICRQMSEAETEILLSEVANLQTVDPQEQREVLSSFRDHLGDTTGLGGPGLAEHLMTSVLGRKTPRLPDARRLSALERLRSLNKLDPHSLCRLLQGETPQMAALVLGQLSAEKAAEVLMVWPEEERAELALRVAKQGQLAPGAVDAIGEALDSDAWLPGEQGDADAGVEFLARLLEDMDRGAGKSLLEELRTRDEDLANIVGERLFTFENVTQLSDKDLQRLLREVEHDILARALKGIADSAKEHILANVSARGREILEQEMELLGPVLVRDVEAAQKDVVKKALELEEAGELTLSAEEEEYVE